MVNYACDFETTTIKSYKKEGLVRVWAWQSRDIETLLVEAQGTDIESYIEWLTNRSKSIVAYFHNLRYDGNFIIDYLLNNGWGVVQPNEKGKEKTFKTLITEEGTFFEIVLYLKVYETRTVRVVIRDSLKKIPISIERMAKAFNIENGKGTIDYDKLREIGYEPTRQEWDYIDQDTLILATSLKEVLEEGHTNMTISGDAMSFYKNGLSKYAWEHNYPSVTIEVDDFIRQSYRGGFVYIKPEYAGTTFDKTVSYDVNSLFSNVMYREQLPFGLPIAYDGMYQEDIQYDLYIQKLSVDFKVKDGYLPTIQQRNNFLHGTTEFITDTKGEQLELYLTTPELDLFFDHHDIFAIQYEGGLKFQSWDGLFINYVEHWFHEKETTTGGRRQIAKQMLNSLYGKFGSRTTRKARTPFLNNDIVEYRTDDLNDSRPVYTAMASFITSYARKTVIEAAQANYDRFIYADTDSIHLIGHESAEHIEIHDTNLGRWKHEGNFGRSKFIRAKTYVKETSNGELEITCSGLPENSRSQVTFDNFELGVTYKGKLTSKIVKGGSVLEEGTFTIIDERCFI